MIHAELKTLFFFLRVMPQMWKVLKVFFKPHYGTPETSRYIPDLIRQLCFLKGSKKCNLLYLARGNLARESSDKKVFYHAAFSDGRAPSVPK